MAELMILFKYQTFARNNCKPSVQTLPANRDNSCSVRYLAESMDGTKSKQLYMHNRHDFHVHRTSSDPESLVDENNDDKDFFLNFSSIF